MTSLSRALCAVLLAAPLASAQDLGGVFLSNAQDGSFSTTNIAVFNPDPAALHKVGLTPRFWGGGRFFASFQQDTLGTLVRGYAGGGNASSSFNPAMAASGRTAYVVDWFNGSPDNGYHIVAQNRDATGRVVLAGPFGYGGGDGYQALHPDVSPDGRTVIYSFGGNLYRVPADGSAAPEPFPFVPPGGPVPECVGNGNVTRAVFSPDGTRIAYYGLSRQQLPAAPGSPDLVWQCARAVRVMNADGTNDRALSEGGFLNQTTASGWRADEIVLDWKAGRLLISTPSVPVRGTPTFQVLLLDAETGARLYGDRRFDAGNADQDSYQLSPDGLHVAHMANSPSTSWVVVRNVETLEEALNFQGVLNNGRQSFLDWADAPLVPEPARLELSQTHIMTWRGRGVTITPTLYATDGSVIVRAADDWLDSEDTFAQLNAFTSTIWGTTQNRRDLVKCFRSSGFEACVRVQNVHTPQVSAEVIQGVAEEEGRVPAVVRITRYGRPHPRINPRIETPRSGGRAQLYVDYTMSEAPPNLSFPGSTALADTLQTLDIVLTPVDDGVDEPTEAVVLFVYCSDGTGLFGPIQSGCTTAPGPGFFSLDMTLLSNGAGSGLAIGTSRPERIGGTGIVTFTLNGQGFTPDMTATLSGPGSFTADTVAVVRAGVQAEARFAFEGAPAGSYTLTLTGPGGTSTLPNAVTIDATIEAGSSDVWALLQSNPFRPGLSATQRIEYGNDGATDAYMVPIRITIPADAEVEFLGEMLDYGLGVTTSQDSLWQLQTIRRPDIRGTLGTGRRGGGDPNMIEQQVAVFYIPFVPAGGTGTLAFQMINSGDSYWTVEVGTPWSDLDLDTLVDDPAMLAADPALAAFAAADCGVGGRMFEDAGRAEACFKCIGAIASAVAGVFPAANCAKAAIETGMNTGLALAHAVHGDQSDAIVSGVDAATGLLEVAVNCANVLFPPANLLHGGLLVYNLFTRVKSGAGAFSGAVDCLKCAGWEEPIWDVLEVFRAADPNEKYGPAGIGDARYVSDFGRVPYEIGFENLATASASAVEIVVTDTLDVDRLDLSTFAFGPVVLPDTTLRPPAGVQSWTTFWDRRPERQSIVRADMHLDRTTGVVRWQMSDLDPETYALQADSLDGFLPPNDGTGRGQGRVSFLVRAVDDLPDGTTLSNRATIRFDREDLIQTNTFSNTLDLGAPTSRVRAVASAGTDSTWAVSWSGTDTAAGVGSYDLYVQADGGPFELWAVTSDTTAVFTGAPGPVYGFFSLAHDWVGNVEPPKTEAEAATVPVVAGEGPSNLPAELTLALPYPNPVRGALVVPFGLPAAELVRVKVFDMQGRVVAVLADEEHAAGWHALRWDADVAAGVYVVRLEAGGVARMRRLTVVR